MNVRPPLLEVVRQRPLVILAVAEAEGQAELLVRALLERFPDEHFIAIICAEGDGSPGPLIAGLRPVLRELIFTASSSPTARDGHELAMHAHDDLGIGQDFVFTVPRLPDALGYALAVIAEGPVRGWEGTAILVPGTRVAIAEAKHWLAGSAGPG